MASNNEIDPRKLGRAIAARRIRLGQKRKWLAEATQLSYPYIAEIENGGKVPSGRAMAAIATALGWSLGELIEEAATMPEAGELPEPMTSPHRLPASKPVATSPADYVSALATSPFAGGPSEAETGDLGAMREQLQFLQLKVDRLDSEVRELRFELQRRMGE